MTRRLMAYELNPIDFKQLRFVKGTYKTFGIKAAVTLISPLLNTIIHWKYRDYELVIDEKLFPFRKGDTYSQPTVIKSKPLSKETK